MSGPEARPLLDPAALAQARAFREALRPRFVQMPELATEPRGVVSLLATPSDPEALPDSSPFLLSRAEWIDLQLGMANLERIAETLRNLGTALQAPADTAAALAGTWRNQTFPGIQALVGDIRGYGHLVIDLAPPGVRVGMRALRTIVRTLVAAADAAERRAGAVCAQVDQLERGCSELRAGIAELHQRELTRVGRMTAATQALHKELDSLARDLPEHQARYHQAVTVAATTVTYGWIPLFGWIAAATVAGLHGRVAVLEKQWIDDATKRSAEIIRELAQQERQLSILARTLHGLSAMGTCFGRVRPVLQHSQGIWHAICGDLGALRSKDAAWAPEVAALVELELRAAQAGWGAVAARAEQFLRHAELQAPADTSPFGRFRTQTRYRDQTFDEHHVLQIDLCGVSVNGVPVMVPLFEGQGLRWTGEPGSSRQDKPWAADIRFAGTAFEGTCTFPNEGPIGWIGTRL